MASENNGEAHGYVWPDGTVNSVPFDPQVHSYVAAPGGKPRVIDRSERERRGITLDPHATREHYDRAFSAWVKGFKRWEAAMDKWEAKHGKA